jgi:hypothetical protein
MRMLFRTRFASLLTVPVVAGLILTGCASAEEGASAEESSNPTASATATATEEDSSNEEPGEPALRPVETGDQAIKKPVKIEESANFGNRVSARVVASKPVEIDAEGPGEVSGPGILINLKITNNSGKRINLDNVTMTLGYGSEKTPANPAYFQAAKPIDGKLADGESTTGTYVFRIPTSQRDNVEIWLDYSASEPIVVFIGSVA